MSELIEGTIVGTFMDERGTFARFKPDGNKGEIEVKLTRDEFHTIKINKPAKIIVEIVV